MPTIQKHLIAYLNQFDRKMLVVPCDLVWCLCIYHIVSRPYEFVNAGGKLVKLHYIGHMFTSQQLMKIAQFLGIQQKQYPK